MAQALYHGYTGSFTMAAASTTLPAFVIANTDANHALQLKKYRIGMAGTGSASVTFQLFATSTAATALGTSTAGTITQSAGRIMANGGITICGYNYTAARTTETYIVVDELTIVNNQTVVYDYPWGDEPDCPLGVATNGAGLGVFISSGTPVATTIDVWVSRI
jgi:hypothetical protein